MLPGWGLLAAQHARALWCDSDAQASRKHCVVWKVTLVVSVYVQKAQAGESLGDALKGRLGVCSGPA